MAESWPPVQRSLYHRHMDQWRKHFPANQVSHPPGPGTRHRHQAQALGPGTGTGTTLAQAPGPGTGTLLAQPPPSQLVHPPQLLVVDGDRFITTPWEEMERVQDFLGIPRSLLTVFRHNTFTKPSFQCPSAPRVITKESFFYNTTKGFYCGITQESACTNTTTSDTTTTTTAPTTSPPAPTTSDTTTTPAPTSSTTAPTTSILVSSSKKKCLGRSKGRPSPPVPLWLCRRLCRYFKPHNVQFFNQIERQAFDWACRCG